MLARYAKLKMLPFLLLLTLLSGCSLIQQDGQATLSSTTSADGSRITYGVQGKGDITLVFVHCWTCNHEFWRQQVEYFLPNYRVVWLDLAGHGLSSSKREVYSMQSFGEDVAAVVNAIHADKVVLVGHSMGGPVVIEAAKLLGDEVLGIVGVDTFYTAFEYPQSEEKISAFVKPFEQDFTATSQQLVRSMFTPAADPELVQWTVDQLASADARMGINAMYEIFHWNARSGPADLERFSGKLRNINAAPTSKEQALHEGVVMIPQVGHFVALEDPAAFNRTLQQILLEFQQQ